MRLSLREKRNSVRVIDKFLDEYVGDTFNVKEVKHGVHHHYHIISDSGIVIISFMVRALWADNPHVTLFRGEELCSTVGRFFDLDKEESMQTVRDWFGQKHGLQKLRDILKFIPRKNEKNKLHIKEVASSPI